MANGPHTGRLLAEAVAYCAGQSDPATRADKGLSAEQQAALVASLMRTLEPAYPDADTDLSDLLYDAHVEAWDAAGQAARRRTAANYIARVLTCSHTTCDWTLRRVATIPSHPIEGESRG